MSQKVPARPEGQPAVREIVVQSALAERTLSKLDNALGLDMREGTPECNEALAILREAFREAHCDATVYNVYFWDLGGNSRIRAKGPDGEEISLPATVLPPIGTILEWNNKTYYVASHRP